MNWDSLCKNQQAYYKQSCVKNFRQKCIHQQCSLEATHTQKKSELNSASYLGQKIGDGGGTEK